jgi:hypothetical protein
MEPRRLDLARSEEECGDNALGRVRRAVAGLAGGELLAVSSPVADHAFAVRAWSRREGIDIVEDQRVDGVTTLVLRRPASLS